MSDNSFNSTTQKPLAASTATQSGTTAPSAVTPAFIGQIYIDTANNQSYVAKSTTLGDWAPVSSTLAAGLNALQENTVLTKTTLGANAADNSFSCMAVFNNKLYVGTSSGTAATDATGAKILIYDGVSWSVVLKSGISGAVAADNFVSMSVYSGKLYVTTSNSTAATDATAAKVITWDDSVWTTITKATMGGVAADTAFYSMSVYSGSLYIGTSNATAATDSTAAKVLKFDGATWSVITKATMGGTAADTLIYRSCIFNSKLYISTLNGTLATDSTAAKLLIYNGTTWAPVLKSTIGAPSAAQAFSTMCVYDGRLVLGSDMQAGFTSAALYFFSENTGWAEIPYTDLPLHATLDLTLFGGVVYSNKLWFATDNTTAAINSSASKVMIVDGLTPSRMNKNMLGGVNADTRFSSFAIYGGKLYIGSNNSTAATDSTAAKILVLTYPTYQNNNNALTRGF